VPVQIDDRLAVGNMHGYARILAEEQKRGESYTTTFSAVLVIDESCLMQEGRYIEK
jgi:hypothetical protein